MKMAAPVIMGIINVTPDSFSGDGLLLHKDYVAQALAQATRMVDDGAGMLDIGGESSRPGALSISAEEEIRRAVPVINAIHEKFPTLPIAIDTVKAEVADWALQAGARIVNDISALGRDPHMAAITAKHGASIILMHNRAQQVRHDETVGSAYEAPAYENVIEDVARELMVGADAARAAGIPKDRIILDPGIGFGKTPQQNMQLIMRVRYFRDLGFQVLMGVSRKSFIGHTLDLPVEDRLEGTAACIAACVLNGADILRVHDVKEMARTARMAFALRSNA